MTPSDGHNFSPGVLVVEGGPFAREALNRHVGSQKVLAGINPNPAEGSWQRSCDPGRD